MNSILILADSFNAEAFLRRISQKDASGNTYIAVVPEQAEEIIPQAGRIEIRHFDPTSAVKLKKILYAHSFLSVFILMSSPDDAHACLENVRSVDENIEIVLLDEWGAFSVLHDSAAHVINTSELIANRLYDHLPNVPVVAQNVGLAQGEVMEVSVPYGSTFAYRHVGSIAQIKWKIAAIYRDGKQILPTNATMIRPQDTLLLVGKPQVLANVHRRISKNKERFPEPFGKHIYLILDMDMDTAQALSYLKESIHLADRLEQSQLFVRVINPGSMEAAANIRAYESDNIHVHVHYGDWDISSTILDDTVEFDIGLIMLSPHLFRKDIVLDQIMGLKKLVLLFGDSPLFSVERIVALVSEEEEMESISSTFFYVAETLELKPCLCYYEPDGDFEPKKRVVEHYETLAKIFQQSIKVEEKAVNPIRAVNAMDHILLVSPLTEELQDADIFKIFSTRLSDYLLDSTRHPQLLIPTEA
jgi:hypothetical protein